VGTWTAELTAIRGMRRFDALPAGDLGLQRCVSRFYFGGRRISEEELRRTAERWGSSQGLAAFYVMVASRAGVTLP